MREMPSRKKWRVRADILVILTAVEKVYLDFGKPTQKALDAMTVSEARAYMEQGQFAPGSMLPKVQACVKFVEAHPGGRAVITSLDHAAAGLRGETLARLLSAVMAAALDETSTAAANPVIRIVRFPVEAGASVR